MRLSDLLKPKKKKVSSELEQYLERVAEVFIEDFIVDATASLKTAIQSELVDTSIKDPLVFNTPDDNKETPNNSKPELEKGTKETINGEEYTWAGAQWISNKTGRVASKEVAAQLNGQSSTTSEKPASQFDEPEQPANKVTPNNQRPVSKFATRSKSQFSTPKVPKAKPLADSYDRLNSVFERLVEGSGRYSIAEYMRSWFGKYMAGCDWSNSRQHVETVLNKLQEDYPENFEANLEKLGQVALALSRASIPAGAPDEFIKMQQMMYGSNQSRSPEPDYGDMMGQSSYDPYAFSSKKTPEYHEVADAMSRMDRRDKERMRNALDAKKFPGLNY